MLVSILANTEAQLRTQTHGFCRDYITYDVLRYRRDSLCLFICYTYADTSCRLHVTLEAVQFRVWLAAL